MIEKAVGQVVGARGKAKGRNRLGQRNVGAFVVVEGCETGPSEEAFGPQEHREVPYRMVVEQGAKLSDAVTVVEVMGIAGGQRPRPLDKEDPDTERRGIGDNGPSEPQDLGGLVASRRDAGVGEGDGGPVLGVITGAHLREIGKGGRALGVAP